LYSELTKTKLFQKHIFGLITTSEITTIQEYHHQHNNNNNNNNSTTERVTFDRYIFDSGLGEEFLVEGKK
jgi:hypothetical protein